MIAATILATAIVSLFVISINADEITSLEVISGSDSEQQCPPQYTRVNQDLNEGAGGKYIYLCYSTNYLFGKPITDIYFFFKRSTSTRGVHPNQTRPQQRSWRKVHLSDVFKEWQYGNQRDQCHRWR